MKIEVCEENSAESTYIFMGEEYKVNWKGTVYENLSDDHKRAAFEVHIQRVYCQWLIKNPHELREMPTKMRLQAKLLMKEFDKVEKLTAEIKDVSISKDDVK